MKRLIIHGLAIGALGILIGYAYARRILPRLISGPFLQDFAQDYIGAQALISGSDEIYPILGPAFASIGINWNILHRSTHPPTAFLLAVPFTILPYRASQILWMVTMFVCIILSAHLFGLGWRKSIIAGLLSLAWPPTIWSLYQFTPIWLLGLVLAYYYRRSPFTSGFYIALASLPKFLAVPTLLYHLRRNKWLAILGFISLWLAAICILLLMRHDVINTYISNNIGNSLSQILRPDNGALLIVAWRFGGWPGLVIALALILWVLIIGLHRDDIAGWACLVWLGIALLPIAWVYSLFPLLPWLVFVVWSPGILSTIFSCAALLLPYGGSVPTMNPWFVALSIAFSGVAFAVAPKNQIPDMPSFPTGTNAT